MIRSLASPQYMEAPPPPLPHEKCDDAVPTSKENEDHAELISPLPVKKRNFGLTTLREYQGFWYPDYIVPQLLSLQKHFKALSTDVLLASYPKSGTTWFMALIFAVENRTTYVDYDTHPLLKSNPHDCVPKIELPSFDPKLVDHVPIFSTHIPYLTLPESIVESGCRIVYIFREPKDVLISVWHFTNKIRLRSEKPPVSLEVVFEQFCSGALPYGPYWNHVLGYWKASLERPERVLFLNYEDMKKNSINYVKRLAEFLGHPFSLEEEEQGEVDKIISLCSFENLSSLEVNKSGERNRGNSFVVPNNAFFREGNTGDWQNHMTKEMAERLDDIVAENLKGSGLTLHAWSESQA